ncbi:hypothetical protein BDU57DRAFT_446192 [Ampelomyces quisqualis]|uniref:Uncharacterized protein n=1 Tax=Ampelomyces quisqualis TaxID=50730 RepID=A0A6A5QUL8_AMPQU|nr:hypothetical protein BDU57DRAFT_446192 [Ampelomyces quisqualis]
MAAPRLPFLWPMLYRTSNNPRASTNRLRENASLPTRRPRRSCREFATTPRRAEDATTQRYGKAYEPAPHLRGSESRKETEAERKSAVKPEHPRSEPAHEEDEEEPPAHPFTASKPAITDNVPLPTPKSPDLPKPGDLKPLDSVLHMPSPQSAEEHKPPHMKTPPYVHHFDTYGLVRELHKSSYTRSQSTTLMKAVRGLLITNMERARAGLVSQSNVSNETYLFRAACSELATEIGNGRKSQMERMRTERAQLQHEVDILGQRLGQETGSLKDELKGLFDDRRMAVRQEQRGMETKIQELNYKITVALNSDARSEVEGLRWVLTRRAAITVGVSAFMLFVALRYTSYVQHQQLDERRRQGPSTGQQHGGHGGGAGFVVDPVVVAGRHEALGGEILAGEGVSLG